MGIFFGVDGIGVCSLIPCLACDLVYEQNLIHDSSLHNGSGLSFVGLVSQSLPDLG